jgi:hypothetical protein
MTGAAGVAFRLSVIATAAFWLVYMALYDAARTRLAGALGASGPAPA